MKKLLTAISALVLGTAAMAQTDKGGWMFGAGSDFGFTSSKADNDQDDSETNISLNARAGYFLIDNLAAGLDISFENSSFGDASSSQVLVGPYVRYFLPMKVFAEANFGFGSAKSEIDFGAPIGTVEVKTGVTAIGLGVGYAAFLNDHVSIEPMVRYVMTSQKPEEGDSVSGSGFGLMVNFGIYLGN
jgi:outer membrane protein